MRCKVGDLAVIIDSVSSVQNIGKIVRVVRKVRDREEFLSNAGNVIVWIGDSSQTWVVESGAGVLWKNETVFGDVAVDVMRERPYFDSGLRPLRDQPGADETLIYAGLPQPIEIDCTTKQGAEHE